MAAEEHSKHTEAYPMKAGDGPNNYAKNSIYQKGVMDAAKELLNMAIAEKLDIEILSSATSSFNIADLGCSVGPNTFFAVENIIQAVKLKYQSRDPISQIPEFQVFFNDHTSNDFNMLFNSPPQDRQYYAAGVPGSFYGRIFPNASLHFVHSSYTNHCLSRVPKDIVDSNSPAWNKGHIPYLDSTDEVVRAYEAQYAEDMERFLHARAKEMVHGGLMGVVKEEKIDSFNIPMYFVSSQEVRAAVERNGSFSIEMMEILPTVVEPDSSISKNSKRFVASMRAPMEGLLKQHFGEEMLDEFFDLFHKKVDEHHTAFDSGKGVYLFFVLKRKAD